MIGKPTIRYSEAFKKQVISELESGQLRHQAEARERYGIGGGDTINSWLRRYGRDDLYPHVVRIETMKERDRIKQLERELRQLKRALIDSEVRSSIHQAYFEILARETGIEDLESYKKKLDTMLHKKE